MKMPGSAAQPQRLPQQLPLPAWVTAKEGTAVTLLDLAPLLRRDAVQAPLSPTAACRRGLRMRRWTGVHRPALLCWEGGSEWLGWDAGSVPAS